MGMPTRASNLLTSRLLGTLLLVRPCPCRDSCARVGCIRHLTALAVSRIWSSRAATRYADPRLEPRSCRAVRFTHSSVPVWAQPEYHEGFVGYGKDRVSYTYELAARGVRLLVQPELFLVHYTTVQRGTAYSHSPKDWMVGETCWPGFAGAPG